MAEKAVVTGGTGGIGLEVARELARRGYAVTVVGRDEWRGTRVADSLGRDARFLRADLSSLAEVRVLGARLAAEGPLRLLINNVGGMWVRRWETVDGIEAAFALNHLSPLVLTEALLDALQAGAPSRIVDVTSSSITAAMTLGVPEYDEVDVPGEYYGMAVSGRAKLAHLAAVLELAERLRGTGVSVFAADPGAAATPNAAEMEPEILPPPLRPLWDTVWRGVQRPAAEVIAPIIHAATAPGLETGTVFDADLAPANALTAPLTPELVAAARGLTERVLRAG
ncbi:SDR family NAD(P)-dependent oxidoreductase [Amycolatopsis sacchari]|uniref:SDR family NAD(P)-dependent oxidoreductase n=1 Tax=Amycolatopsis sacchari TaxID=115433 RepID=UPI003EBF3BF8